MVDQSELPYRLLCRRYGAQVRRKSSRGKEDPSIHANSSIHPPRTHKNKLAYTPMVHAACYLREKRNKRNDTFLATSAPGDWPLVAQLCGNDPATLLAAARELCAIEEVVAVDLNLGCPQVRFVCVRRGI